jgi:hypothetical protein
MADGDLDGYFLGRIELTLRASIAIAILQPSYVVPIWGKEKTASHRAV